MIQVDDDIYFTEDEWPMCPVDGCENRVCLRLHSSYCYPHTFGVDSLQTVELLEMVK